MCTICKKFKKGSIDVDEARELLEESMEFLSEEHIEEVEEMLFQAEDTYDYMMERHLDKLELDGDRRGYEDDEDYIIEEDLHEEVDPEDEDE